ncbi:HIT family protein [uncultured Draconibacterium sp.]|uniref:HIT family protein n=1 Tax=uncultured Draconibacterium sp. TaxID=1573823 RepID=UPI0029C65E55|nr:HIT family protein [uncultured Draconibacterium sp.]
MLCPFCNLKTSNSINDTVLYENEYFVVVPAKGPITEGHVLIVSKSHDLSLLCVKKEQKRIFVEVLNKIAGIENFYGDFLFFEHGSYNDSMGGKTIDHTHIHVIPNYSQYANVLDGTYLLKEKICISEIPNTCLHYPYLLIGTQKEIQIYEGADVKSQEIRIKIAENNPKVIPNWQDEENINVVKKTINMWKNVKF